MQAMRAVAGGWRADFSWCLQGPLFELLFQIAGRDYKRLFFFIMIIISSFIASSYVMFNRPVTSLQRELLSNKEQDTYSSDGGPLFLIDQCNNMNRIIFISSNRMTSDRCRKGNLMLYASLATLLTGCLWCLVLATTAFQTCAATSTDTNDGHVESIPRARPMCTAGNEPIV